MNSDEIVTQQMAVVCNVLTKHEVDFMIVGGFAVSVYGYRRPSTISLLKPEIKADFDFWYKPSLHNFQKLLNALKELKVDTTDLKKIVFDPQRTFLKIPHKGFHTDFLPSISGVGTFSEVKKNSTLAEIDGSTFPVIGYNDLILSKLAINRKVDQEDIQALEVINKKKDQTRTSQEEKLATLKKKKRGRRI